MSKKPSPNDQRSIVKNPNNLAYVADQANRQNLGHDNAPQPPEAVPAIAPVPPKP